MSELEALRDMLDGAENDLLRYQAQENCGDPALEANYRHKAEQVARIRGRIEEIEKEAKAGETAETEKRNLQNHD